MIQRALELAPDFARDLFTRALHGRTAVGSGGLPFRNVDRQDTARAGIAELLRGEALPELNLRDAGETPFGVDVNDMTGGHRHVPSQIELYAVHPFDVGREL